MQIVAENANLKKITIIKSITTKEPEVFKKIHEIANKLPEVIWDIKTTITDDANGLISQTDLTNVVVYENFFNDLKVCKKNVAKML